MYVCSQLASYFVTYVQLLIAKVKAYTVLAYQIGHTSILIEATFTNDTDYSCHKKLYNLLNQPYGIHIICHQSLTAQGADAYTCAHAHGRAHVHTRMRIHTDTQTRILNSQTKETRCTLAFGWCAPGLKLKKLLVWAVQEKISIDQKIYLNISICLWSKGCLV